MSRLYTIQFNAIAVTAQVDLFEILPATQKPVLLHGLILGQTTDYGDAQDEGLLVQVIRGHTTSGSGGASVTPVPMDSNATAAGATCERTNTTIASAGTGAVIHSDVWNVRAGYQWIWTPETKPRTQNANIIVVRMAAPADSITMSGTLYFEEV
jgi:hypothetical protein